MVPSQQTAGSVWLFNLVPSSQRENLCLVGQSDLVRTAVGWRTVQWREAEEESLPTVVQGQGEDLGKPFVMMADTQQPLPVTTLPLPSTTISFNPQQSPYKGK